MVDVRSEFKAVRPSSVARPSQTDTLAEVPYRASGKEKCMVSTFCVVQPRSL